MENPLAYQYGTDQTFKEEAVLEAALALITDPETRGEDMVVSVSRAFDRKGQQSFAPLDFTSSYTSPEDDTLVTISVLVPAWNFKANALKTVATQTLTDRKDAATKAAIAEKEAQIARLTAEVNALRG